MRMNAHVEDEIHFLVEHCFGQAETWNLAAHHAAAGDLFVEEVDFVTLRGEVTGNGQGGWATPDQGNFFAIFDQWNFWQPGLHIAFIIGSYPFEAANGHGFFINPATAARGFTRPVAGTSQYTRKNVRLPIDHVGFGVAFRRDQSDILRYGCMRWAGILTIHNFVEIFRIGYVCRSQCLLFV